MPVRLIVFDLDGTLLGADNRLSDRTASVLAEAKADGLILVAASGRSRWATDLVLEKAAAIDYAICSNGAVLYDRVRRRVVSRRTITPSRVAGLHARVNEIVAGAHWAWETERGVIPDAEFHALGTSPGSELDELLAAPGDLLPGDAGVPIEDRLAGFGRVVRGLLTHPELECQEVKQRLKGRVPARLSSSSAIFLEVTAPNVHKGDMLKLFCSRRGIDASEVVAFGDHLNDVTMLRWAGRGVAMASAHPRVLELIPERTDSPNDEDGVAVEIEKLLANR